MGKTIQVRKPDTLKEIAKLQKKHNLSTATSAIDLAVGRYSSMKEQITDLQDELYESENKLREIKLVIKQKLQADEDFKLLFKEE